MNTFPHVFQAVSKPVCAFLLATLLMFAIPYASAESGIKKAGVSEQQHYGLVSLNKASAKELSKALTGIGKSKAEAIVAYREKNGAFKDINELLKVKGIGQKTLEKNKAKIAL